VVFDYLQDAKWKKEQGYRDPIPEVVEVKSEPALQISSEKRAEDAPKQDGD
jgi:hypothetical protein